MTDLAFNGGKMGFNVGNQQFTTRNLSFVNVDTAIQQLWDWGWTYKSVSIKNCRVGLNISAGGPSAVNVGSITFFDSEINDTMIGIVTARTGNSEPAAAASLYLENVKLNNVGVAVQGPNNTYLAGTSGVSIIDAWADGHRYLPSGPIEARGRIAPSKRPVNLIDNSTGKYYERSKPQYGSVLLSQFLSARDLGCEGDGITDDTEMLNDAILKAQKENKILFIDAGFYKVTGTIFIPPGSKIVGEALATVILSAGEFFNNMASPQPVVKVARQGDTGSVEISDLFLSTQGQQKGAILMEYNLGTYDKEPSGLWDVHTRIGGFAGSNLQTEQCEKTRDVVITADNLVQGCIAAYMSIHITRWARGLYMENNWLWTADHDLDDARNNNTQITIYTGRGLLVESINGVLWLYVFSCCFAWLSLTQLDTAPRSNTTSNTNINSLIPTTSSWVRSKPRRHITSPIQRHSFPSQKIELFPILSSNHRPTPQSMPLLDGACALSTQTTFSAMVWACTASSTTIARTARPSARVRDVRPEF